MRWEVRISYKKGVQDPEGESTLKGLRSLGFNLVKEVQTSKVFSIQGEYTRNDVERMCKQLLVNPVSQDFSILEVTE